jgi:moderate conductance mechanosensitive channel
VLVLVFAGLGYGVEWLFRRATQKTRQRLDGLPMETVNDRLRLVAARFAFTFCSVVAFAIGSVGLFLALNWPPLLGEMVLGYLVAFLVTRIALVVGHFLLAPDAERFRIVPTDTAAARFWRRRLAVFVGWLAFGWVTVSVLTTLGFSLDERHLVAYVLGLGLLAIALESVWRRPVAPDHGIAAPSPHRHHLGRGAQNALLSVAIVLLWGCWVARAMPGFWLLLVVIALPLGIRITQRVVEHLLRPPGSQVDDGPPRVITVSLERGLRALLIIGAAAVLAWGWDIDLVHIAGQDTAFARIVHGALSAVIILLVADLVWQATKTAIDRKLVETADPGQPNTDEARRRARLHTLLPIFRNILFVVVIAVGALMALAAMGFENRPAGCRFERPWRRDRLWRAEFCPRHHRRHVLPARRRFPDRRIHPERQLQGHRRRLQHPLGQAAASTRRALHRAVRPVGSGAEPEPRLDHRQADGRHHL